MRDALVDDDFMVAEIHRKLLTAPTRADRPAGAARSGAEALEMAGALHPDLILLDVYLPDMTGLDVLKRLRSAGDAVGVIMITAARELDTVSGALDGGAADYLIKLFQFPQLQAKLEAFAARADALSSEAGADQSLIDSLFGSQGGAAGATSDDALPKGLGKVTGQLAWTPRWPPVRCPRPNAPSWWAFRGSARVGISSTSSASAPSSCVCSTARAGPSAATGRAAQNRAMDASTRDSTAAALRDAERKANTLFDEVVARGLIVPGVGERQLSDQIRELAERAPRGQEVWHKRIVRAGANTMEPYAENPPERVIGADDIVFLDFGPIFADWEADFGRTYVLGDDPAKHRLADDLPRIWAAGRQYFEAHPDVTGAQLYAHVLSD